MSLLNLIEMQEGEICYTWQGKNVNIPDCLLNSQTISILMGEIARNNIYASSCSQFEKFCSDSLYENKDDCFCSVFIYTLNNIIRFPLSPCTRREEQSVQKCEAVHERHSNDVQGLNGNRIIVGFLNVRITFSDAEIDFICVDSQYRRNHVAKKMINFFENLVVKQGVISKFILEVGAANLAAIHFYEKLGYEKISVRKKYYKNNEDAIVMSKNLYK